VRGHAIERNVEPAGRHAITLLKGSGVQSGRDRIDATDELAVARARPGLALDQRDVRRCAPPAREAERREIGIRNRDVGQATVQNHWAPVRAAAYHAA
jgi:hypothetical protein